MAITEAAAAEAAAILWRHWRQSTHLDELPEHCRPATRAEGYAIQAEVARRSGYAPIGWKIAATSAAGQRHINVDGPLAGRLLSGRQLPEGAVVPLDGNVMNVAEAEFAFRMGRTLAQRHDPYDVGEVLDAVESLHPAIEVPDSRYADFVRVGGPQLIADTACACWFLIGGAAPPVWRERDLVAHEVAAYRNGALAARGQGANVLGDPRLALTWIANELRLLGGGLREGEVVMTGTCIAPLPVARGDRVRMDFGELGTIDAVF
jgi:2-keto-4-pentenoate hydratase